MKLATTILVFCVAALLALGMVILYSSRMMQDGAHYLSMQLTWCALGLVVCGVAVMTDYHWLKKFSVALYVFCLPLLVAVFFFKPINAAQRWIKLGGFTFQPSELAKIAVIICLAHYAEHYQRQMNTFKRGVLHPVMITGVVLALIFKEPDVGNTMLLALVASIMLLLAGLRWRYFLPPVAIGSLAVGIFIAHDPMRSERIYSWLHLEETKQAKGHQAYQAMVALGSGGVDGLGLGNGRQKYGFVPEHHTDFIFSIIGEELGLIATLFVVAAFVAIFCCGLFIATRAPDKFGMLLGYGITFMIGVQSFINMGVVTGLLPNKGMPLPFISYGGSNLLMMLGCVGVLLNISRHGVEKVKATKRQNPFEEPVVTLQEA